MDKPLIRDRKPLPSLAEAPNAGGMGNTVQTVPMVRIDKEGAKRVPPQSAALKAWEVTVRYDSGSFDSVTLDSEPQFKIGDRVRLRENLLEPLKETTR